MLTRVQSPPTHGREVPAPYQFSVDFDKYFSGNRLPAAGGIAVGVIAAWPAFGWIALLARPATIAPWMAFVASAVIGAVALFVYWWPRMFEREVVFDWQHRLVRWRYGSRSSELPLSGDPLTLLDECHHRYGNSFTLNIAGNGRFVMLAESKDILEVFQGDPDVRHSGEENSLFTATVGRQSVLVLDGAQHVRQRRVLVPPLKGERIRAFFDAMPNNSARKDFWSGSSGCTSGFRLAAETEFA